jgi:UDP-N-acetylmuramate dehydrogenase
MTASRGRLAALREAGFRGRLLAEEPLAPYTTWRIGGPAELLALPADREDLFLAARWARSSGTPWRVLGNGSNLLVADDGVRGLVIRTRRVLDTMEIDGSRIRAGAGAMLPAIANLAASRGLAGLEFAAGIPATVGGALVMNAGWHEHEIGDFVQWVDQMTPDGSVTRHDGPACGFRYRGSRFRGAGGLLLQTELLLEPGDPSEIRGRLDSFAASRKANQPTELPSCGSVFVQPKGDYAGRLIDEAGLKGTRVGDLEVSTKHANFFVNHGEGTSRDALALVERVEDEIERRFGVCLEREFEYWS